jgi:hypothetical protein
MTDFDTELRTMLRERANDIDSLPADFADLASLDVLDNDPIHDRFRRPRTGWLIAAVIAAVLAVGGIAIALQGKSGHGHAPPATHSPTGRPTTTPAPSLLRRATCAATLPRKWSSAIAAGTSRYGATSVLPLAISPDGSAMLVARDFGQARDVALVRGSGSPRSIYSVPQPDENQVVNASLDDKHAVIDLDRLPRNSNGVIPGARQVLLITLSSGAVKQLDQVIYASFTSVPAGRSIDGSLLWNGHVYWDVRTVYTDRTTTIRDYDIATGKTTTAGTGTPGVPRLLAAGVTFDPEGSSSIAIPRHLPSVVAAASLGRRNFLVTDGRVFAWTTATKQIAWWVPGDSQITVLTLPRGVDPELESVNGPFLVFDDQNSTNLRRDLLDARTGATAPLPSTLQPILMSAGSVALGYSFTGAFKTSSTAVVRLDTNGLPGLTC